MNKTTVVTLLVIAAILEAASQVRAPFMEPYADACGALAIALAAITRTDLLKGAGSKVSAFLVIALTLGVPACRPQKPVQWPEYVRCAPDMGTLVGTVTRILFEDDDYRDTLSDLARAEGPDTILCIVEQLVADWTAPGAAADPQRIEAAKRGRDFVEFTGSHVDL